MEALVFDIRINSLYSIRIPFTWQSALTYPILPPSAVIGMLANALQRLKNDRHPLRYLEDLEKDLDNKIVWAGSRLMSPCIIKSYITSAITKWEDTLGGKFTNALGRQFAYARNIQAVALFKKAIPDGLIDGLMATPLTAGDSESPISLENPPTPKNVKEIAVKDEVRVNTFFHAPFEVKNIEGNGRLYLMHERCLKKERDKFPLISYVCPVKEEEGILNPTSIKVLLTPGKRFWDVEGLEGVIVPSA
jgi:CRISPR-associated Cas5-like protein